MMVRRPRRLLRSRCVVGAERVGPRTRAPTGKAPQRHGATGGLSQRFTINVSQWSFLATLAALTDHLRRGSPSQPTARLPRQMIHRAPEYADHTKSHMTSEYASGG